MNTSCKAFIGRLACGLICLIGLGGVLPADGATGDQESRLVRLHADLPDTLEAATLRQLDLFGDIQHLRRVWFDASPWGGVVAIIELDRSTGRTHLQRGLSPQRWQAMCDRVAGFLAATTPVTSDPSPPVDAKEPPAGAADHRAWPEVPLSSTSAPETEPAPADAKPSYPPLSDKWLLQAGLGYQRNISSYREFFSDQGQLSLAFAKPMSRHLLIYLGVDVGFGDLQNDFEQIAGDGRGNNFGLGLGLMLRATAGRKTSFYLGGAGGYYVRSMTWGSPIYGDLDLNSYARNLEDLGVVLRAGLLLQQSHPERPRFIDIGVSLQMSGAEGLHYWQNDRHFIGRDRDMWFALAVRFWDTI